MENEIPHFIPTATIKDYLVHDLTNFQSQTTFKVSAFKDLADAHYDVGSTSNIRRVDLHFQWFGAGVNPPGGPRKLEFTIDHSFLPPKGFRYVQLNYDHMVGQGSDGGKIARQVVNGFYNTYEFSGTPLVAHTPEEIEDRMLFLGANGIYDAGQARIGMMGENPATYPLPGSFPYYPPGQTGSWSDWYNGNLRFGNSLVAVVHDPDSANIIAPGAGTEYVLAGIDFPNMTATNSFGWVTRPLVVSGQGTYGFNDSVEDFGYRWKLTFFDTD